MMDNKILVGSRSSKLALEQTRLVIDSLRKIHPEKRYEIVTVETAGDKFENRQPEGKQDRGFFVRGIEEALRAGRIDFAVHSAKDLPRFAENSLEVSAIFPREDPRDVLVTEEARELSALPPGARVGTGSLRRKCELLAIRDDLQVEPVRGNVPTRISKLKRGSYDAIILAAAGLARLDLLAEVDEYFSVDRMVPAAGQGALALQVHEENKKISEHLAPVSELPDEYCVRQEKKFIARLSLGCSQPVGAYGRVEEGCFHLDTVYYPEGPGSPIRLTEKMSLDYEADPGLQLADETLQKCK